MTITEARNQLNEAYKEKYGKDVSILKKRVDLLTKQLDRALNKQSIEENKRIKELEKKVTKHNKLLLDCLNNKLSTNINVEELLDILNK